MKIGVAALVCLSLVGCGETYIDTEATATTAPASTTSSTTLAPVPFDAEPNGLVDEIATIMFDLDERIITDDAPDAALERIEELWAVLAPQLEGTDRYRYGQAVELAQTGVDRNRPADASKGYKILNDLRS